MENNPIDYKLISCDDHLDLNQIPADLWTSRLPAAMRDRAPHIEERDGRAFWICDNENWGRWSGKEPPANGPKPIYTALDRGGIVDQTERRPAVPELRLADMDRDGVGTSVIYGPVTSLTSRDPLLRDACHRVYNEWLAEFCSAAPERLLGVPMLPPYPEPALAELEHLAAMGCFRQANLQIAIADPPLRDPRWEPLFRILEETGIILSFHVTVILKSGAAFTPASNLLHAKSFVEQFLDPFVDLFAFGILERHPGLKIAIAESGAGWLPWIVEELDYRHWRVGESEAYWADKGGIPLKTKPSELFKRQIYASFQQSPVATRLLEFYGDNLLWASDYPHPDSIWPNSREIIRKTMGHLPPEAIKRLTHDNAARLYRLDKEEPAPRLAAR